MGDTAAQDQLDKLRSAQELTQESLEAKIKSIQESAEAKHKLTQDALEKTQDTLEKILRPLSKQPSAASDSF